MEDFFSFFKKIIYGNPVFPVLTVLCAIFVVFLSADSLMKPDEIQPVASYKNETQRHHGVLQVYPDLLRIRLGRDRAVRRIEGRTADTVAYSALQSLFKGRV